MTNPGFEADTMINPGFFEADAMNGPTGGNRGPWRAGTLAVAAAVAVLAAACDVVHVHFGSPGDHDTGRLEAGS